jgi:hypothetical protein
MKNVVVLPGTLCVLMGIAVGQTPNPNQYQYPFQNPSLSIEERVSNIISLLTLLGRGQAQLCGRTRKRQHHVGRLFRRRAVGEND